MRRAATGGGSAGAVADDAPPADGGETALRRGLAARQLFPPPRPPAAADGAALDLHVPRRRLDIAMRLQSVEVLAPVLLNLAAAVHSNSDAVDQAACALFSPNVPPSAMLHPLAGNNGDGQSPLLASLVLRMGEVIVRSSTDGEGFAEALLRHTALQTLGTGAASAAMCASGWRGDGVNVVISSASLDAVSDERLVTAGGGCPDDGGWQLKPLLRAPLLLLTRIQVSALRHQLPLATETRSGAARASALTLPAWVIHATAASLHAEASVNIAPLFAAATYSWRALASEPARVSSESAASGAPAPEASPVALPQAVVPVRSVLGLHLPAATLSLTSQPLCAPATRTPPLCDFSIDSVLAMARHDSYGHALDNVEGAHGGDCGVGGSGGSDRSGGGLQAKISPTQLTWAASVRRAEVRVNASAFDLQVAPTAGAAAAERMWLLAALDTSPPLPASNAMAEKVPAVTIWARTPQPAEPLVNCLLPQVVPGSKAPAPAHRGHAAEGAAGASTSGTRDSPVQLVSAALETGVAVARLRLRPHLRLLHGMQPFAKAIAARAEAFAALVFPPQGAGDEGSAPVAAALPPAAAASDDGDDDDDDDDDDGVATAFKADVNARSSGDAFDAACRRFLEQHVPLSPPALARQSAAQQASSAEQSAAVHRESHAATQARLASAFDAADECALRLLGAVLPEGVARPGTPLGSLRWHSPSSSPANALPAASDSHRGAEASAPLTDDNPVSDDAATATTAMPAAGDDALLPPQL